MRFISAIAGAFVLAACTIVPPPKSPAPSAPVITEPAPVAAPKAKAKKPRKDTRSKKEQNRSFVSKGAVADCGLVRWAASTFDEDHLKRLERSASAEQKRHAKACLDGKG